MLAEALSFLPDGVVKSSRSAVSEIVYVSRLGTSTFPAGKRSSNAAYGWTLIAQLFPACEKPNS